MGARIRDLLDDARALDLLAVLEIVLKHGMTRRGHGYLFNHFSILLRTHSRREGHKSKSGPKFPSARILEW